MNTTATTVDRDIPFGFGAFTPTGTAIDVAVPDKARLIEELNKLAVASAPATRLTLAANVYDFTSDAVQQFTIRAQNVTIQSAPDARVVLQDFGLLLEIDSIDNILIRNLLFRSDGSEETVRGAIDMRAIEPTGPTTNTQVSTTAAHVRITHCSFDGYFDIAVDSRSYAGAPRLLVTIDQCLFFDATPGQPTRKINGVRAFTNRGAINFGSLEDPNRGNNPNPPQLVGNARVTVAYNVFVNVWRRCPRVATGNFGHIFNNFLYQWGFGNDEDKSGNGTSTWRGMEVGGGNGVVGGGNNGTALIEGNRFIPFRPKDQFSNTININASTMVDIGTGSASANPPVAAHPNEFDKPNGTPRKDAFPTAGTTVIDRSPYGTLPTPEHLTGTAAWTDVVNRSGPRSGPAGTRADDRARQTARNALPRR